MLDVLLLAALVFVCAGIGLPIAELLPARFAGRWMIAPIAGLGASAVVVTVAYRLGAPLLHAFFALLALAAASWARWGRRIARRGGPDERRIAVWIALAWLGAIALMMLPRWVGGEQFSVFQGNMWDAFGYLQSAVVYARRPYAVIRAAQDADLVKNPLFAMAQGQLLERPSVHLLYATFSRVAPAEAYRLYYPFLVGCLSQCLLAAAFLLRNALPKAPPAAWLAAAAVFPLGFWGQYVFDLNAWSQIAAAPGLLLIAGLVLLASIGSLARGDDLRTAAVLAILVAGAAYLYPEGFAIHAAALGPIALVAPAVRMIRTRRFAPRELLPCAGLLGLVTVVLYPPLLQFLIKQVTWSAGNKVWWWRYFQIFFYGRDGAPDSSIDFAGGLLGLYFATPPAGAAGWIAALLRAAIAVAAVGLIAGLIAAIGGARARTLDGHGRAVLLGWSAAVALLLAPAAYFAHQENYWPAGKMVAYAAPVFMTLLAAPIGFAFERRALRPLRWIAFAFVGFQLALAVVRIPASCAPDGIHYAPPYPAVTEVRFKRGIGWDLRGLDDQLSPSQRVLVRPMDTWPEGYLMMYLYTHRFRFAKQAPVNTYFGAGRDVGSMTMHSPDVEISLEPRALVLHYRDGRADVRVPSRVD